MSRVIQKEISLVGLTISPGMDCGRISQLIQYKKEWVIHSQCH
jgi:hypothetical protein